MLQFVSLGLILTRLYWLQSANSPIIGRPNDNPQKWVAFQKLTWTSSYRFRKQQLENIFISTLVLCSRYLDRLFDVVAYSSLSVASSRMRIIIACVYSAWSQYNNNIMVETASDWFLACVMYPSSFSIQGSRTLELPDQRWQGGKVCLN